MAAPTRPGIWRSHAIDAICTGPNLTGIDPQTGQVAPLFHPRRDRWFDHFAINGVHITGLSAIGRATVQVLDLNDARRLELRSEILKHGDLL